MEKVKPEGFPKAERLRGERRISGLFASGQGGFVYPFRYIYTVTETACGASVLVSVPKKLHKRANKRNLLKRRTREAYRTGKAELLRKARENGRQVDLALLYVTKDIEDYSTVSHAVGKIIGKISQHI